MTEDALREIERCLNSSDAIPLHRVREWMQSDAIEVQGQAADMLSYPPYCDRIEPAASEAELEELLFPYYRRCILEDPDSELADSRYGTAAELVAWFFAVSIDEDVLGQTFLLDLKDMLAALYLESDEEVREAVVSGFLEHVLEEPRWREFFADWKTHPQLRIAYREAMEWAVKHERRV